jgi:small-conductance mechanosensitive channel
MQATRTNPARPHLVRAGIAAIVAIAGAGMAGYGALRGEGPGDELTGTEILLALGGALLILVAGIFAVRYLSRGVREALDVKLGPGKSTGVGLVITIVGYIIVLLATLKALGVDLGALLVGGALTGVILGIAAQQSLGNFFAGIVLMIVRPFTPGEEVALKSAALGGEYSGFVTDVTLFYVHLSTERGPVQLPNAGVLAAAIGPGVKAPPEEEEEEQKKLEEGEHAEGG